MISGLCADCGKEATQGGFCDQCYQHYGKPVWEVVQPDPPASPPPPEEPK